MALTKSPPTAPSVTMMVLGGYAVGDSPSVVTVFPDGTVEANGATMILDAAAAKAVIANFTKQGVRLVIDFEHQSLPEHNRRGDGKAPAAGWIDSLDYVTGVGLRAHVSWTDEALGDIRGGKYRYLSPVVLVDEESRRIVSLHSAGLTNKPAIPNFPELVAAKQGVDVATLVMAEGDEPPPPEPDAGNTQKLAKLLGLPADTAMPAIIEAAIAFVTQARGEATSTENVMNAVRVCWGMDAKATRETVIAKVEGHRDLLRNSQLHAAKLQEQLGDERRRAKGLEDKIQERKIHALIDDYTRQGKLTKSMELVALEDLTGSPLPFEQCIAAFKKRMDAQPVIIPQGQSKWSGDTPEQSKRRAILREAASDYDANSSVQRMCSRTAFVANALREKGLEGPSKDEISAFGHGS